MKKDPRVYLLHIRDAVASIERYTTSGKETFLADKQIQDAVVYNLAIIGEAVKRLPAQLRSRYASVPWKSIAGTRDIVIHDYSRTDVAAIWSVVEQDVPQLRRTIAVMLRETGRPRKRRNAA
jgi:uncharacterized protein with HEPN domain